MRISDIHTINWSAKVMAVSKFRRASRNGVKLRCILRHTYDLHIGLRYLREHACCWFRDIKRPNFIGRPWRHHQWLPVQFINDWPNQKRNNSWNLLRQNNRKLDHGCSSASRQLFWDQEFYTVTCTKTLIYTSPPPSPGLGTSLFWEIFFFCLSKFLMISQAPPFQFATDATECENNTSFFLMNCFCNVPFKFSGNLIRLFMFRFICFI